MVRFPDAHFGRRGRRDRRTDGRRRRAESSLGQSLAHAGDGLHLFQFRQRRRTLVAKHTFAQPILFRRYDSGGSFF